MLCFVFTTWRNRELRLALFALRLAAIASVIGGAAWIAANSYDHKMLLECRKPPAKFDLEHPPGKRWQFR
jgi:hypothetical protein